MGVTETASESEQTFYNKVTTCILVIRNYTKVKPMLSMPSKFNVYFYEQHISRCFNVYMALLVNVHSNCVIMWFCSQHEG